MGKILKLLLLIIVIVALLYWFYQRGGPQPIETIEEPALPAGNEGAG